MKTIKPNCAEELIDAQEKISKLIMLNIELRGRISEHEKRIAKLEKRTARLEERSVKVPDNLSTDEIKVLKALDSDDGYMYADDIKVGMELPRLLFLLGRLVKTECVLQSVDWPTRYRITQTGKAASLNPELIRFRP